MECLDGLIGERDLSMSPRLVSMIGLGLSMYSDSFSARFFTFGKNYGVDFIFQVF